MKSLKVHCFQHVSFEGLGCIKDWCEANGHQITYTRFFENETIPQIENYDWLIIMGGPMGVYDENKYLWLSDEKTAIRNAILHNKTVIGICLGSQLIANVLGAKVYKNPVKEIGWFDISLTEQGIHESLFVNFDVTLKVFHWHGDTFDLPENAKHIAYSEMCTNQAFLYKKNVLGLQFHLEVTAQSVAEMVENGNAELDGCKYIQCKSEISAGKNFMKLNNNKMFQLLNNLVMKSNRRGFIKQTAFTSAGIGLVSIIPSHVWASKPAPSDKINVALVGCRNMGFGDLSQSLSFSEVNCVALCDIDETVLKEKAAEVRTKFNQTPKLYKDFRKMLEQKDIDAVFIGTPDHWHCLITVACLEAGKDVYVEKPMANTIEECNIMVRASQKHKQIVQVGQQQRSGFIFKKAMELIKTGKIGTLRKVNMWANFEYGIGPDIVPDSAVPNGVDYEMWLGPAPERPFNINRFHGSWRHFWDYGGGLASDWGVHLVDMALWAKDIKTAPEKVLTYAANTFPEKRARETFDTMTICYPKNDFVINYDLTAGLQRGPWDMTYGIAFIGDHATIVTDRSKLTVYPEYDNKTKKLKTEEYKFTKGKESHNEHVRNFLDCIKSRQTPACPPEIGRAAALHVHIANIAGRVNEPALIWDDAKNKFTNSEAANQLITPQYRKPWTLPKY